MNNQRLAFAAAGSLMTVFFLFIVNRLTTPDELWFIAPSLAVLEWPIVMFFAGKNNFKHFASVNAVLMIGYLYYENVTTSPDHPWYLYAAFAIVWWPILAYAGKYAATFAMSVVGSIAVIASYAMLNATLSPEFPWAIFPAYAVLWWPISVYCARSKQWFGYSIVGTGLTIAFFVVLNAITTDEVWAIYPIFAVMWWPLSMYYYSHRKAA